MSSFSGQCERLGRRLVDNDSNKNIAMKNVRPCKGAEVMFGERFIFLISQLRNLIIYDLE
jgi:hypothetical protein